MAKIKWNWPFIIGFLAFVVVASGAFLVYAGSNHFCGKVCHTMKIYNDTWQVSSHGPEVLKAEGGVKCEECHYDKGLGGFVAGKMQGMRSMFKQIAGTYTTPIMGEPKEARCKDCHDVSKLNETETHKIPHKQHEEMNLNCMSCHGGLVHGFEGEGEAKVTHDACKQCHDVEKPEDCTKCHKW